MKVSYILNISFVILFFGLLGLFLVFGFLDIAEEKSELFSGLVVNVVKYDDSSYVYVKHEVVSKVLIDGDERLDLEKGDSVKIYGEDVGGLVVGEKIVLE